MFRNLFSNLIFYACRPVTLGLVVLSLGAFTAANANTSVIRLGYQPWPGVTVKTQVVSDLLNAFGYKTEKKQFVTSIILQSIATGNLDVNLGIWYPLFKNKYDPFAKKNKVVKIATNLPDMVFGYTVPEYVHQAGVNSIIDLQKYANKFGKKFYGIEPGAAANQLVKNAINANRYGLGDWKFIPSSTGAEMAQVEHATKRHQWVVFVAWKPHWMNVKYNLYYLKAPGNSPLKPRKGDVYTVVTPDFTSKHPNAARFLKQFSVSAATQSQWTFKIRYKNWSPEKVAQIWIQGHMKTVAKWLDGVKTRDGKSAAIEAVRQVYGS